MNRSSECTQSEESDLLTKCHLNSKIYSTGYLLPCHLYVRLSPYSMRRELRYGLQNFDYHKGWLSEGFGNKHLIL